MSDDEKVSIKAEDATPSPKKTPKSGRKKKEAKRKVQTPASATSSTSKRSRKSAQSFEPVNFKEETVDKNSIEIPAGRGDKLQDISVIHTTINNMKSEDPVLRALHKFLLGGVGGCLGRGRTPIKFLKKQVLEFSGYLPEVIEGDEESEEAERIAEVSFFCDEVVLVSWIISKVCFGISSPHRNACRIRLKHSHFHSSKHFVTFCTSTEVLKMERLPVSQF